MHLGSSFFIFQYLATLVFATPVSNSGVPFSTRALGPSLYDLARRNPPIRHGSAQQCRTTITFGLRGSDRHTGSLRLSRMTSEEDVERYRVCSTESTLVDHIVYVVPASKQEAFEEKKFTSESNRRVLGRKEENDNWFILSSEIAPERAEGTVYRTQIRFDVHGSGSTILRLAPIPSTPSEINVQQYRVHNLGDFVRHIVYVVPLSEKKKFKDEKFSSDSNSNPRLLSEKVEEEECYFLSSEQVAEKPKSEKKTQALRKKAENRSSVTVTLKDKDGKISGRCSLKLTPLTPMGTTKLFRVKKGDLVRHIVYSIDHDEDPNKFKAKHFSKELSSKPTLLGDSIYDSWDGRSYFLSSEKV